MAAIVFSQISILLFAFFSGREEGYFTYPFRVLGEKCFPNDQRRHCSKMAHRNGAAGVGAICFGLATAVSALQKHYCGLTTVSALCLCVTLAILFLFNYWLVFDPVFARFIKKRWYYLGTTADMDVMLQKLGVARVGIWKAVFCLLAIAALNCITFKILA